MDPLHAYISTILASFNVEGRTDFFGNSISQYIVAIVVFFVLFFALHLLQWLILRWLGAIARHTKTTIDDTVVKIVASFQPPFYAFLAFWLAMRSLAIEGIADKVITGILITWMIYQSVIAAGIFIEEIIFHRFLKDRDPTTRSALRMVTAIAKAVFWGFGFILLLSNLGVDVTTLIAGVSISGIAVAFALQNVLADLFSAFVLYLDRPFDVGDCISAGVHTGKVKHIGLRSTRLVAVTGEEVTIPNQELAKARIQNFARMRERHVTFTLNVAQDTPYDKLTPIIHKLREIVEGVEGVRFERAHFSTIGPAGTPAYVHEVSYVIHATDMTTYLNVQQLINLKMVEYLKKEEIRLL